MTEPSRHDIRVAQLVETALFEALTARVAAEVGDFVPRAIAKRAVEVALRETSARLRFVAQGRRAYMRGNGSTMDEELDNEAMGLETAADIADGDLTPMFGLLPSWWWTDEMRGDLARRSAEREAG